MKDKIKSPEMSPKVTPQHCLRTRFNGSSCALCRDACPSHAPALDGVIAIDAARCSGCLLCAAACPTGAIEPELSADAWAAALNRQLPVVLCCHQAAEECHLRTPCLGFLTEEYLLALYSAVAPGVDLNLSHCAECVNSHIVDRLTGRLAALEAKTGLPVSQKVRLVRRAADLQFEPETVGRRGFFTSLTRTLLREASQVMAPAATAGEKPKGYAQKHLPLRRALLNRGLELVSAEERQRLEPLFRCSIVRDDEACDGCRACTKACPTGALLENVDCSDEAPPFSFEASSCTGCGLCVEFCLNQALSLTHRAGQASHRPLDGSIPSGCIAQK
jgi:formate hydrogenlyase subunit 6/NADH:ubiquinone oxidoreductase subunit I